MTWGKLPSGGIGTPLLSGDLGTTVPMSVQKSNTVAEIQPDQIRHILARIEGKVDALAALVLGQIGRVCPPPNCG